MPETPALVLLSVLILGCYIFRFIRLRRTVETAFSSYGFSRINKSRTLFVRWVKNLLLLLVIILLTKSLYLHVLDDDEIKKKKQKSTSGTSVKTLLVLDASLSMITKDVSPSRIEKAKLDMQKVINMYPESHFAIIPFAGSAYLQCPFTDDHDILLDYLGVINRASISKGGSSLSSALTLAIKLFDRSEKKGEKFKKRMVIFSDGADYSGESKELYSEIKKREIDVAIVGVGGDELVPIVYMKREGRQDLVKRDRKNNIVKTKLDEDSLEEIAEAMGGEFITDVKELQFEKLVSSVDKKSGKVKGEKIGPKFIFYVIVPLVVLILETLISTRTRRKLKWAGRFCQ